jgi:hypothetical protein
MAAQYYASITVDPAAFVDVDNSGTSSTSTDSYEFRMGNGTYLPNRVQALLALKRIERWIVQGGLDQLGANLPLPPTGTEP